MADMKAAYSSYLMSSCKPEYIEKLGLIPVSLTGGEP
jgi:hypothetical protein